MAVITLTTDLGISDYYAGALKGAICSRMPEAVVVDITHSVPPHNIHHAAYVLRQAYPHFPKSSIHIIGVKAEAGENNLAILCDGHYFIGTDNGIFSLLFEKTPDRIFDLSNLRMETALLIFPVRDLFVQAACHLARGGTPEILGREKEKYLYADMLRPVVENNIIHAAVIYVDAYYNVTLNITRAFFYNTLRGKRFSIEFKNVIISSISQKYSDVRRGEILALFNSADYLELATNEGELGKMYAMELNTPVLIRIEE